MLPGAATKPRGANRYEFYGLDDYIAAAGIGGDNDGPLFRSVGRKTGRAEAMWQQDVYRMIQRRATAADIATKIGNHTFRATGITAYLKNGGTLEHAQSPSGINFRFGRAFAASF